MSDKRAFIIVDLQNDFCEGGALAVPNANEVIPVINKIREEYSSRFDMIVLTQDYHPQDHISFASNHPGQKIFDTIKDHCVQGKNGSEFHKDLVQKNTDKIVRKGMNPKLDSYSAFLENDKKTKTDLEALLKDDNVKTVFVCGLATDYCAGWTSIDAANSGFTTYFVENASSGIAADCIAKTKANMVTAGVKIINSADLKEIL